MSFDPRHAIETWLNNPNITESEIQNTYHDLAGVYGQICVENPSEGRAQDRFHTTLKGFDLIHRFSRGNGSLHNLSSSFANFLNQKGCPDGSKRESMREAVIERIVQLITKTTIMDRITYDQLLRIRDSIRRRSFSIYEEAAIDQVRAMTENSNVHIKTIGIHMLRMLNLDEKGRIRIPFNYVDFVSQVAVRSNEVMEKIKWQPLRFDFVDVVIRGILADFENPANHRDSWTWQQDVLKVLKETMDRSFSAGNMITPLVLHVYEGEPVLSLKFFDALQKVRSVRVRTNIMVMLYLSLFNGLTDGRFDLIRAALELAIIESNRIEAEVRKMSSSDGVSSDTPNASGTEPAVFQTISDIFLSYEESGLAFRDSVDRFSAHHMLEGVVALMRYPSSNSYVEYNLARLMRGYIVAQLNNHEKSGEFVDTIVPLLDDLLSLNKILEGEQLKLEHRFEVIENSTIAQEIEQALIRFFGRDDGGEGGGGLSGSASGSSIPPSNSSPNGLSSQSYGYYDTHQGDIVSYYVPESQRPYWLYYAVPWSGNDVLSSFDIYAGTNPSLYSGFSVWSMPYNYAGYENGVFQSAFRR